jgi:FMN phosphatase YigB (HAD superfamily)
MSLTLLLDLDDTLLTTNPEAFNLAYFQALARELTPQISPERMIRALVEGIRCMNESEDFSRTLEEVFDSVFYSQLNISKNDLNPAIENFYDNIFPTLANLTSQIPTAKPFIDWAFSKGCRIVIATDPLLPRKATYHRLRWAGFEPDQFELISSFDHFSFTKSHPAYYAEVLGRMGWPEGPVLMVGNDMERDILPARKLGLATYHIQEAPTKGRASEIGANGDLVSLQKWLESIDLNILIPDLKSVDSVMAVLKATPAVLMSLTRNLDPSQWSHKTTPDNWALIELISHLRDTEREINQLQIGLFTEQTEPFIPRPDTSVWASQRDYLREDGKTALREFVEARQKTVDSLKKVDIGDWSRKARHAIFGPTNFLEVIGFIGDHDRMHLHQAWRILRNAE